MGLFDTVRRMSLARVAGVKAADITWDGDRGWTAVRGKDGDDLPRQFYDYVMQGYRRNAVVRRCVDENKTSLSEAPIHAYSMDADGNYERLVGHPAEELFSRPNARDSGVEFIERAAQHYLLGGNTFWEKERTGFGIPTALYPIRPDYVVGADVDDRGVPLRWEVIADLRTGRKRWIDARDLVHIPDTDPLNEVFGMPRLAAATMETDTDNKANNYVSEILSNYGSPGTVVSVDAEKVRNAKLLERAEEMWTEKFGPGRGRGKVAFLPGAQRVQNVGFDLQELEFKDLRHVTREGICSVFGVDPAMVGLGTAAKGGTLSGGEFREMREAFWEQTIIPMIRRWNAVLNAFVAPEYGENVWLMFDLSEVSALQPDRDKDVERANKMAETGTFTPEEIRAETGAAPELDDDAVVVVKGNVTYVRAGDRAVEPEEEEEEVVDPEDGEPTPPDPDDEEEPEEEEAGLTHVLALWEQKTEPVRRLVSSIPFTALGYPLLTRQDRGPAWKQFDDFARSQEPVYRLTAEDLYRQQEADLTRLAFSTLREEDVAGVYGGGGETKAITPESLEEFKRRLADKFDEYHRAWRRKYDDLMSQTVDVVAGRLSGTTGLAFNVFNPLVRKAIDERLNLIVGADELTFRGVQEIVEEGFTAGLGRQQIADRVARVVREGVYMGPGKTQFLGAAERAKMIATTETTAISNGAAVALMRTTDIPWVKMWLSQGDDRVREEHLDEEADSEENPVPLEEAFRVTGLEAPGEPRCRCTVLFEQA